MQKLKRGLTILAALACAPGASIAQGPKIVFGRNAVLLSFQGEVVVARSQAAPRPVKSAPLSLQPGSEITTLQGKAEIRLTDGSQITVAPGSAFKVANQSPSQIEVDLSAGKLWAVVSKKQGREFRVRTPSLVAAVRGTIFSVEIKSPVETIAEVQEGVIVVRAVVGKKTLKEEARVRAGERIEVANGKLGKPRPISGLYRAPQDKKNRQGSGATSGKRETKPKGFSASGFEQTAIENAERAVLSLRRKHETATRDQTQGPTAETLAEAREAQLKSAAALDMASQAQDSQAADGTQGAGTLLINASLGLAVAQAQLVEAFNNDDPNIFRVKQQVQQAESIMDRTMGSIMSSGLLQDHKGQGPK